MYLLRFLSLLLVIGQANSFFFGNLSFGPEGATFSAIKKEAEKDFLEMVGHKNFLNYVNEDWLKYWNQKKGNRKYKKTEIEDEDLDWWDNMHIYVPPKKKKGRRRKCGRRRRRCKREAMEGNPLLQQVHSRQKRQTCFAIPGPSLVRSEWRQMTQADRESFIDAFNDMIATGNQHNIFIEQHRVTNAPSAHNGAGFLPWHREFLWRLSNTLRTHGYTGGIPYWDSVVDVRLPNPADSAVWTDMHFGRSNGLVNAPWQGINTINACQLQGSGALRRNMKIGDNARALMMDGDMVNTILGLPCFQDLTKGWNTLFEEQHERMLLLMGTQDTAQMADANCAPTDPIYWLHVAFMDSIWERYRDGQDIVRREIEYPLQRLVPAGSPIPAARHRWNRNMRPFEGLRNIHGLSNHYTRYYYRYSQAPSEINCGAANCGGDMYWCQENNCIGKIRVGGVCDPEWPNEQCHCPSGTPVCNDDIECQCL